MRKCILIFAVATIITSCNSSNSQQSGVLTVEQYWKEYDKNEINASEKYDGKLINISGTIQSINKGSGDKSFVTLTSGFNAVNVYLRNFSDAKSLQAGQQATFEGISNGKYYVNDAVLR